MKKLILFTLALIGTISAWAVEVTTAADLKSKCEDNTTTAIEIGADIPDFQGTCISKTLTIDLKGHTITCTNQGYSSAQKRAFLITATSGKTVTFKSTGGKGSIIASNTVCMSCIRVNSACTVNISDIKFKLKVGNQGSNNSWMCVGYNASGSYGEIRNCEVITGDGYYGGGFYAYGGTIDIYDCKATMDADPDGVFLQQRAAVGVAGKGTITIHSGEYSSVYVPCAMIFSSGGTLNIVDGTYTNTTEYTPKNIGTANGNQYRCTGAVYNDGRAKSGDLAPGTLAITGGTFNGYVYEKNETGNSFTIGGGSFKQTGVYTGSADATPSTTVTTYVTSDNEFIKEGDNYVAVKKLPLSDDKYVRSVPASGCGTICLPNNAAQPAGVTFYGIVGKDKAEDPTYIVLDTVKTDLEAGTPYIFNGTPSASMEFTLGEKPDFPEAATINGLIGTLAGVNWDATKSQALKADDETLAGMYLISGGEIKPANATGAYLAPNRAYIDLEEVPVVDAGAPGRRIYLNSNETTGCDAISAESAQAQKVMLNGKLFIRRGAQLFDAQGALVK